MKGERERQLDNRRRQDDSIRAGPPPAVQYC